MEIVFLGTGTGVPSATRAAPALLLRTRQEFILVDAGAGTLRQLVKAGFKHTQIDHLFLTHFHPDHVAELVPFLFALRYWPDPRGARPVRICGPQGLRSLHAHLKGAFGHWIEPDQAAILELPLGQVSRMRLKSAGVSAGPIPHTPQSLGFRFSEPNGKSLVVTGDTEYGRELIELAGGADLLVTECSFPNGKERKGHLTPKQAGRVAREAGVRQLALTHFYPETEGVDLAAEVAREFSGPVILANDLDRMDL